MTTLWKLTDKDMRTLGGFQWRLGETRTAPGTGPLCSSGWLHAYEGPWTALVMNPVHAAFRPQTMRLFEAEGTVGIRDGAIKCGTSSLTLVREHAIPALSPAARVRFAIYCVQTVIGDRCPEWSTWATSWLSGADRTAGAARAAAEAAWEAEAAAAAAAFFSARAAAAAEYESNIDIEALARAAFEDERA